ncbi:hypothetical protein IDH44_12470 [Paenibacillus sp. IB182496]|uniref:Uncharacterized protein n=1 Tax=Paenibacillus sabuli TaxID=2772509 RepID=A0A927BSL2_9BACL|nr:hypothetical protein [Paenibacillus sabuli]MBD2846011.1 hypothetical protein [Paenibacillus sabuli]
MKRHHSRKYGRAGKLSFIREAFPPDPATVVGDGLARVTAPSVDGGDKEYVVVFAKKAVYEKPSFL